MSFEIQELPDVIKLITLLSLERKDYLTKPQFKKKVEKYLNNNTSIELNDLEEALEEMVSEGLVIDDDGKYVLTNEGFRLGNKWKSVLMNREPILEVVAGLTDGTITGIVVILSTFLAQLSTYISMWAALLSLAAVAITNFSRFMLGGKTEDIADTLSIGDLMIYSVSDIPDKAERKKSLSLLKHLFSILKEESTKTNFLSALTCGVTTFLAGITPITAFLYLPSPFNFVFPFLTVGILLFFLIRYRSQKSKVHWKITLLETSVIVTMATIASLLIGNL